MKSRYGDDFLDFIMMLFFSGLIYGLSRCFELFPAYESFSFMFLNISSFWVEMICVFLMFIMIIVFFRNYSILSLLMVGLSPYVFYQFLFLLYEYVVFRYIFLILTVFFILFYLLLVIRYDEVFNVFVMLNRYCITMFYLVYIVVVSMVVFYNKNGKTVQSFQLSNYNDTFIKFKQDHWNTLSLSDKEDALEEFVVVDLMYLLGEEDKDIEVRIKSLDSHTIGGYYSFEDEEIIVNDYVLSNRDKVISVLLHESYHRYQHKVIDALEDKMDLNMKIIRDVKEWKDNIYNYVSADDNFNDYYNQSLEKSARVYAEQHLIKYLNYIDELKERRYG